MNTDTQFAIIATWSNGVWCAINELDAFKQAIELWGMDFIFERVIEWDGTYFPYKTEKL